MKNISCGLLVAAASISVVEFAYSAPEQSDERLAALEEVIVTAQKRAERLQDVPISISVMTGKELDTSTDRGVIDALSRVPGVVATISNTGQRLGGNPEVIIRGVSPTTGTGTTGYYLDTIPFGFVRQVFTPDVSAYDLQQVEVLRGPQGTLYGAAAVNGVVRILTQDADLGDLEFKARSSVSSTEKGSESYRFDAAANLPIVEGKLASRLVLGYQDLGGWIDKPFKNDANDAEIQNARLKINAQPNDRLSLGLFGWLSRSDIGAPTNSADGERSISTFDEPGSTDFDAYGAKIAYEFPAFTLTSATSYIDFKNHSLFDYRPFITNETRLNSHYESAVFAEEVVLNSTREGVWRWTLGGIYRDAEDHLYQLRSLYLAPTDQTTTSKSYAVFGELTRELLDGRFEITGGLRYFNDDVVESEASRLTFVGGIPPTGLVTSKNSFDKVTPRVILSWHPSAQGTFYASYGQGFRSGLNQQPTVAAAGYPPVDPDVLSSYEIGAKQGLWGGRLNIDAAVYYIDWQDVQQSLQAEVSVSPRLVTAALINAGSASGFGLDFGATIQLIDNLTFGVTFAWNDLRIDHDVIDANGRLPIPKDARLTHSPETTAGAFVDYAFPVGGSGFEARLSAAGNYFSRQLSARTGTGVPVYADAASIARASLALEAPQHWTATLFVDNLTSEEGLARDPFSPQWNTYLRPRTFGVQFEVRY